MKDLKLIIQILETERQAQNKEFSECHNAGLSYAAQYASGKTAAYSYAIGLLKAFMEKEMPFDT